MRRRDGRLEVDPTAASLLCLNMSRRYICFLLLHLSLVFDYYFSLPLFHNVCVCVLRRTESPFNGALVGVVVVVALLLSAIVATAVALLIVWIRYV